MTAIVRWMPGRALMTLEPFYRPLSLIDEIEELARGFWDSWLPVALPAALIPYMDVYEEKDELVMKTELTGVKREDLDIRSIVLAEGQRLQWFTEEKVRATPLAYGFNEILDDFFGSLPDL